MVLISVTVMAILTHFYFKLVDWFCSGSFQSCVHYATGPLLKKANMDPADVRSYRPISNLSVASKLRTGASCGTAVTGVPQQVRSVAAASVCIPCAGHVSTETAVLKVLSDILLAIDAGDLSALVLLDLSAAFDTVDHDILLQRLKTSFGLSGMVLEWFRS